jgi:DNA gyrase/topoisomerase IV subunit A
VNGRKDVIIGFPPCAWKERKLWCEEGKEEVHFFPTRRRTSTNAHDEDENMNNDSLIEQMLVVVVFARSTPGKALNTLSCEAIIVVRFGGHFSPRTGT